MLLVKNSLVSLSFLSSIADIRSGNTYFSREEGSKQDDESHRAAYSREALSQLLKLVELRFHTRYAILMVTWIGICLE